MARPVSLLILEDNKTEPVLGIHELHAHDFAVDWQAVESRQAFLDLLDEPGAMDRFDLVLADLTLPGYNALAALLELKTRGLTTPFIIVTGALEDGAAVECIKRGATDCLRKDGLDRLGPAVERALDERRETIERERMEGELEDAKRKAALALEQANTDLERRIADRTRELTDANARLMAEIAQRERIQHALNHAQKMKAVGTLSAGVAHHFSNLLTVVLGNIEMALQKGLDPTVRDRLEAAHHASKTGARLTRQLLSFSRLQIIQPELVEPSERLTETAALLSGLLRNNLEIEVDLQPGLWPIRVDFAELELAILNLAFNARDALPAGGTIRVAASNQTVKDQRLGIDGRYLVVEVSDNGEGIAEHVLPNVFDPFFTTKAVGAGSGLGLSQVHGFAHQAGGAIDIHSALGSGTTVSIFLPVATPERNAAAAWGHKTKRATSTGRILVVDDDVLVARLSGHVLREAGFDVELNHMGDEALATLAAGEPFDLLISDIVMPGMSGIELAECVRARYPDMRILLVSGQTDACAEFEAKGLPVLIKPFSPKTLTRRVSALLGYEEPAPADRLAL